MAKEHVLIKFLTRIFLPLLIIGVYLLVDFILIALFTNIQGGESVRVSSLFYPLFLFIFPLLLLLHGLISKISMYITFNLRPMLYVILGVFLFLTILSCYKSISVIVAIRSIVDLAVLAGLVLLYFKLLNWAREAQSKQLSIKVRFGLGLLSAIIIFSYSLISLLSRMGLTDYTVSILYAGCIVSYAWYVMIALSRYNWLKILMLIIALVNIILLNDLLSKY